MKQEKPAGTISSHISVKELSKEKKGGVEQIRYRKAMNTNQSDCFSTYL